MLSKNNRLLAVLLAAVLSITAFGSDFYSAKVWAADEETVETIVEGETAGEAVFSEGETFSETEESSFYDEAQSDEYAVTDEEVEAVNECEEVVAEETAEVVDAVETEGAAEAVVDTAETEEALVAATADALEAEIAAELGEIPADELAAELLDAEKEVLDVAEVKNDVEEYPAQSFFDTVAGMNVSVDAAEGAFPEGTTMRLSAVSDSQAVSAAEDALDGNVKEAKGVDISFANKDGEEVEPKAAVSVSITLADALEGDSFSVVHLDDNGNSEMVAGASSNGASFSADAFSVYILAGLGDEESEDSRAVATYNFIHNGEVFNSQRVKAGDTLQDPGNPYGNEFGHVFLGWFEANADGSFGFDPFTFGTVDQVEAGATYNVYSSIANYDVTYGDNGAFSLKITVATGNNVKEISLSSAGFTDTYSVDFILDGQKIVLDSSVCEYLRNHVECICHGMQITCQFIEYLITISEEKEVEPESTYITYHINYGDDDITYTVNTLTVNEAVEAISNSALNWAREGYRFLGWSKKAGENNPVFATIGAVMAADNDGIPNDLYAVWEKIEEEQEAPNDPTDPEYPADPVDPKDPKDPVEPENPTEEPSDPTDPEDPEEEPSTPADPEDPADPEEEPSTPEESSDNEEPVTPVIPNIPETPTPTDVSSTTDSEPEPEDVVVYFETSSEPETETETAPIAELPEVLGATRSDDLPEVLGARRAGTSDTSNIALRIISIIAAALAVAGLILLGGKKEEEED